MTREQSGSGSEMWQSVPRPISVFAAGIERKIGAGAIARRASSDKRTVRGW